MAGSSRSQTGRVLLLIGRIGLASIFLIAAYAKLKPQAPGPWSVGSMKTSLSMFAMQVDSFQLLSSSSADLVAHTLPFFELFLGLWILSGIVLRQLRLFRTRRATWSEEARSRESHGRAFARGHDRRFHNGAQEIGAGRIGHC